MRFVMRTSLVAALLVLATCFLAATPADARRTDRGYTTYSDAPVVRSRRATRNRGYRQRTYSSRRSSGRRYAYRGDSGSSAGYSGGGGSSGIASFYWQPQRVASGGWFNPNAMTAAHKTLPFGTRVRVTHMGNGRSVVVTINDRGPYVAGRIIDLSKAAAGVIGMQGQGLANVRMEVLGR